MITEPLTVAGPPPSPHFERPKVALWHLRTWARVIVKDRPGNRRRITCSNPKKSKSQGRTAHQEENSANTALVSKHLHFTDDLPQHFKLPDRSLHPASACIGNAPYRQRPPTSTDETCWNHIIVDVCIEGTRWKSKKIWPKLDFHMNLCKLLLGAC